MNGVIGKRNIRICVNALELIWIRKLKTSDHKLKSIIKASYPKVTLLEQLGSSLPIEEENLNNFRIHVFQAFRIWSENTFRKVGRALPNLLSPVTIIFTLERNIL